MTITAENTTDGPGGGDTAGAATEGAQYRSSREFVNRVFASNRPAWEPSASCLSTLRLRLEKSRVVVICCRFEPEQIAYQAIQPRSGEEGKDWLVDPAGRVANGDLGPLLDHVRRNGKQALYRIALDSSGVLGDSPGLLDVLADDARRTELIRVLDEQSATLLVIVKHVLRAPFRDLKEEFASGCDSASGWVVEIPWEDEMPRSWAGAPSVRAADRAGDFSSKVHATLSDPQKRKREYYLFEVLSNFSRNHVWDPFTKTPTELNDSFDAAITEALEKTAESEVRRARKWTDDIDAVLKAPDGEAVLEKYMLATAACLPINVQFGAFRQFGEVALHGESIVEEAVLRTEERQVKDQVRAVVRERGPTTIDAASAWNRRFDHLARAVGLDFRRDQDQRVVQFPDPSRKNYVRRQLFEYYPSLVQDLAIKLLKVDALFHIQPAVRDCAGSLLTTLDDFDSSIAEDVLRMALARADSLAAYGPAQSTPNAGLPKELFMAPRREHAVCVIELFRKVVESGAWTDRLDILRDMLIDPTQWRRGPAAIDGVLIRTEVLLALPLGGLDTLAGHIDAADMGTFADTRDAMLSWPRNGGTKVDLLLAVSPWLQGIVGAKELRRSQMLAMILWKSAAVADLWVGKGRYRAENSRSGLGSDVFLDPSRAAKLLPHLMDLGWHIPRPGGIDADSLLNAMCMMALASTADSLAEPVLESHRQELFKVAADVLIDPKGKAEERRTVDPATVRVGQILEQLRELAEAHSHGDPRSFEILLVRFLSHADSEFIEEAQPLLKELERRLQPLKRMTGAMLAHWCFEHTGIESSPDTPDERITAFLDTVAQALPREKRNELAEQWAWLSDQFERIGRRVRAMSEDELDKQGRHAVASIMDCKAAKLRLVHGGLAYRMDLQSEEQA